TVTGYTVQHCRECAKRNGVWLLRYRGGCVWDTDEKLDFSSCGSFVNDSAWRLHPTLTGWYLLSPGDRGSLANPTSYEIAFADFNCQGNNAFAAFPAADPYDWMDCYTGSGGSNITLSLQALLPS